MRTQIGVTVKTNRDFLMGVVDLPRCWMSKSHASNVTNAMVKKRKCLVATKKNTTLNVKINGLDSMLAV